MHSLRLASISLATLAAACGAGARYQAIGSGRTVVAGAPAAVGPGTDATAGMTAAVALPADRTDATYKVDLSVWLPRAMIVDWTVRCGSATRTGFVGEPFEAYRERRLAELRSMQIRKQETASAVGAIVGDAVIGQHQAAAEVVTPGAQGEAVVAVDGAAAGAAAGAAMVSTDVELAPGDLGQGYRRGSVTLLVPEAAPGPCAVELTPREALDAQALAYLAGTFEVARLDDAARWQATQARKQSLVVRADLKARLIAGGADVDLRWKRAEADRLAREAAAAERARLARIAAEERARIAGQRAQVALTIDGGARSVRASIYGYLTLHGADPNRRARLEAEAEAHRAQRRAEAEARRAQLRAEAEARRLRLQVELDLRVQTAFEIRRRLRGQCIGRGGDPTLQDRLEVEGRVERDRLAFEARVDLERRVALEEAREAAELEAWRRGQAQADRRAQMALGIRAQLTAQLTGRGAIVKPPMPDAIDEMPGEPPISGYAWASGEWQWTGVEWRWMRGHWIGPTTGGAVVTSSTTISIPTSATISVPGGGITIGVGVSAGTKPKPAPRPRGQDHR